MYAEVYVDAVKIMYTYTYRNIHIHAYAYIYIYIHIHTCVYIYIHIYIYIYYILTRVFHMCSFFGHVYLRRQIFLRIGYAFSLRVFTGNIRVIIIFRVPSF